MKPIITSAKPSDERPVRQAGGRRPAPQEPRPRRSRRAYTVYGGGESAAGAMPNLRAVEPAIRRGERVRREPWPARLRAWAERYGFTDMWNKSVLGSDRSLVLVVVILVALGLLMVYSAAIGVDWVLKGGETNQWFQRQIRWVVVGIAAFIFFWRVRYTFWRRWSVALLLGTVALLLLTIILDYSPFGRARSLLPSGSIQPAEIAKLILVMYMADWLSSKREKLHNLAFGLVPFTVILGGFSALVVKQKASTAILLAITAVAMFYIAGADAKQLGVVMALMGGAFGAVSVTVGYIHDRLAEYWMTLRNPAETVRPQLLYFMDSLREGGFTGKGLGRGTIKDQLFASHSDGIFAVIGEEFGLLGAIAVIGLFVWLGYRGVKIALNSHDHDGYGQLLAFGITVSLVTQALIHIGVVTVTLPATGIPLPFISYGGTALVTSMAGAGLLLSISCASEDKAG